MSGKANSESKPNDAGLELAEYLIGGAVLKLAEEPDQLWAEVKGKLAEGLKPSPLFLLQWQRSAMHFKHLGQASLEMAQRIEQLEARIAKLEKRGAKS